MKLWSKGYAAAPLIERYEAARNAALDLELVRHDIWGSLAHAQTLRQIDLLNDEEWSSLRQALLAILQESEQQPLSISATEEDIHTVIENMLVARIGDIGKKLHTGRSRNDQVLVDIRLWAKEALLHLSETTLNTAQSFQTLAQNNEWVPMPGYTHMQKAMLSSVGLWAAAYAEALLDDLAQLEAVFALNDQCPLGSGAAFGSPLPLDRALTATLLGFDHAQHNVLTAANARGKTEAAIVQALTLIMIDLSKFAQDLLLYTTSEFDFFAVPPELCSGSSMMPQKHNLGAMELVRARAHTVIALESQMLSIISGLPSGYNMDFQETKQCLFDAMMICQDSLEVVGVFAASILPKYDRLAAACTAELFATDRALAMASDGIPFRDAYRIVAANPSEPYAGHVSELLKQRIAIGTAGNLQLENLAHRITLHQLQWKEKTAAFIAAIDALTAAHPPVASLHSDNQQYPDGLAFQIYSHHIGSMMINEVTSGI